MPSKSKKQSRFMRAAAHDKEFADKHNIDQDVAREFVKKDQEEKETKLMYKYKSWVYKKQDAIIKIANDLQLEKAKQTTITT